MATTRLDIDVGNTPQALKSIVDDFAAYNKILGDTINVSRTFNDAGKETSQTAKLIGEAGKTLTLSFKETKDGFQAVAATVSQTLAAQKKAADDLIKIAQQVKAANAAFEAERAFPAPSNATSNQLIAYNTGLNRIQSTMASSSITAQRYSELLAGVAKGQTFSNLTIDERNVVNGVNRIKNSFNDAKVSSDQLFLSFQNLTRIGEALLFKRGVSLLTISISEAVSEAKKLQIAIAEIRTVSQNAGESTRTWLASLTKVSNQLGLPVAQVAEGAYQALSNQVANNAREVEAFNLVAGEFARTTKTTLPAAVELLSTSLNSYGHASSTAETDAAQFFKIIELGRIRSEELVKTLGRLTPLTSQLGVTLPQAGSIVALLTNKGVGPETAVTQTLNLFNSLAKPSTELSKALKEMNFDSAQTAISVLGLNTVLERLNARADGSAEAVSKLFANLRAASGFRGLQDDGLATRKSFEDQIVGSQESYTKAVAIRAEPAADNLTKTFNEVKNYFINNVAQDIIESTNNIVKVFQKFPEGVAFAFNTVVELTKTAGFGLSVYGTIVAVTTAKNILLGVSASAAADGTVALTAATTRANGVLATSAGLIGLAAAAGYLLGTAYFKTTDYTNVLQTSIKGLRNELNSTITTFDEFEKKQRAQGNQQRTVVVNSAVQVIGTALGTDLKLANEQLDNLRGKITDTNTELKSLFANYSKEIRESLASFEKVVSESRNALTSLVSASQSFGNKIQDTILSYNEKYGSDDQQVKEVGTRISQLRQQNVKLVVQGDVEALKQFEKNSEEIIKLIAKQQSKINDVNQRGGSVTETQELRDNARLRADQNRDRGIRDTGEVNTGSVKPRIDGPLAAEQRAFDKAIDRFKKSIKQQEDEAEKHVLKTQDTLNRLNTLREDILKFTPFKGGKLTEAYKTDGKPDEDKLDAAIDKFQERFKSFNFSEAVLKANPIFVTFQKQLALIKEELAKISEIDVIEDKQRALVKLSNTLKDNSDKDIEKIAAIKKASLDDIEKDFKAAKERQRIADTGKITKSILGFPLDRKEADAAYEILIKIKNARKKTDLAHGELLTSDFDPAKLTAYNKAFKEYVNLVKDNTSNPEVKDKDGNSIGEGLLELSKRDYTKPLGEIKALALEAQSLSQQVNALTFQAETIKGVIGDPAKLATPDLIELNRQLDETLNKLKGIKTVPLTVTPSTTSVPYGFDDGGFVGGRPGRDTNLIRASRDEFIMNSEATSQFRPILEVMNASKMWSGASNNSGDSFQFGDINVSSTGNVVGTDIISQIKRAIRTGQLRL